MVTSQPISVSILKQLINSAALEDLSDILKLVREAKEQYEPYEYGRLVVNLTNRLRFLLKN